MKIRRFDNVSRRRIFFIIFILFFPAFRVKVGFLFNFHNQFKAFRDSILTWDFKKKNGMLRHLYNYIKLKTENVFELIKKRPSLSRTASRTKNQNL